MATYAAKVGWPKSCLRELMVSFMAHHPPMCHLSIEFCKKAVE